MAVKRWNGWGYEEVEAPIPVSAGNLLSQLAGPGGPRQDAQLEEVLGQVPESKLDPHPLIELEAEPRLRHARGQSLGDWLQLRYGRVDSFPDAVACPHHTDELRQILDYAHQRQALVIPYGGGTSVVGHLTPPPSEQPVLTVSLARMNQLLELDTDNQLATFQAGVAGPDLEATLRARGYTLGHFPQSFEFSTLGGWVVTRSSGQQSLGYGRIEDQFAGGLLLAPAGDLKMPCIPASAAGPDLRQLVMGSEGRMGVLAEATVRVRRQPDWEKFAAVLFPAWEPAQEVARKLARSELCLSMMRLSDAQETQVNLGLAGWKVSGSRCLMLMAFTSPSKMSVTRDRLRAWKVCMGQGGIPLPGPFGKAWKKNRFRGAYMRNSLWELGYAVDTLETCLRWSELKQAKAAIEAGIRGALGEQSLVFSHLSHFYGSGCSLYTTYLFPLRQSYEEMVALWQAAKGAASAAIVEHQGTISHQHGVGLDHKPYLEAEKGSLGLKTLEGAFGVCDPQNRMNPGKLL